MCHGAMDFAFFLSKRAQVIVYIFSSELWQKACKRRAKLTN